MSRRTTSITTLTPTAYADTVAMTSATFPFMLRGGTAIQRNDIYEITFGGQASASAVAIIIVGFSSTLAVGANSMGAGQNDASTDGSPALANIAVTGNTNATSGPQRGATLKVFNMSFNAYGGIARMGQANADRPIMTVVGNAVNTGEISVSAFTGGNGGPIGGHMDYESL